LSAALQVVDAQTQGVGSGWSIFRRKLADGVGGQRGFEVAQPLIVVREHAEVVPPGRGFRCPSLDDWWRSGWTHIRFRLVEWRVSQYGLV
jgi:hypothetical protein